MTNFEYYTQSIERMIELLDEVVETEQGTQQVWQEYLGDSAEEWLKKEY
jgi:hypothetical protein